MADIEIEKRLSTLDFNRREAKAAFRGQAVPKALGRRLTLFYVIHGIRYNEQFAEQPDLQQIRRYVPEVSRALNARAIMSNKIPLMSEAQDRPYCIWHPQVATQDTYRKLWQQYPDMSYQVARACAVANYVELYLEMDLLPDVSVAEEARASGSMEIYKAIMQKPVRYRIMNDYTREITLQDPIAAYLNDNTAIVSYLDIKQLVHSPSGPEENPIIPGAGGFEEYEKLIDTEDFEIDDLISSPGYGNQNFNITEDMNVGEFFLDVEFQPEPPKFNYLPELLSQPLPVDLPQGNKDVLILMAAYYGNIERYSRLRRPLRIEGEIGCLVRGIYHNSMFALWCEHQPEITTSHCVKQAIHARMIMNNDLSRVINLETGQSREEFVNMPYLIWFPNSAESSTYKALAAAVPGMRPSVLHAAVYTDDKELFDWLLDDLGVPPTRPAWREAQEQQGRDEGEPSYFIRRLKSRSEELEIDIESTGRIPQDHVLSWQMTSTRNQSSRHFLSGALQPGMICSGYDDWGIYNGIRVDASEVELFASAPESWRPKSSEVQVDYKEWPLKKSQET